MFEFKKRTTFTLEDVDDRIRPQYLSYNQITINHLDDILIPRIQNSDIFINYLFYNSDQQVIAQIINVVPIQSAIYNLNLRQRQMTTLNAIPGNINNQLMERILNLSKEREIWNIIYVPFTFEDIQFFKGKGGAEVDVHPR